LKALYENLLLNADTLVASSQNANFPVTELLVQSSNITFRSVGVATTITVDYAASIIMNSLGIANHNLAKIKVVATLAAAPALDTGDITTIYDTDVLYFAATECDQIVITATGDAGDAYAEIGSLYMGLALTLPNPVAHYDEGLVFTSERLESDWGTVYGSGGVVLRPLDSMLFYVRTQSMKESIITMLRFIKNFNYLFVDVKDEMHSISEPVYCTLTNGEVGVNRYSLGGFQYNTSLSFKEAT